MNAISKRRQLNRLLVSLVIAALMAVVAAVLAFFFAVQPVWSTSAQMQAELQEEMRPLNTGQDTAAQPAATATSITWEEAVAGFMKTHVDRPINQELTAFDGVEPEAFFRVRQGTLVAPTVPNDVAGKAKLYMIPGQAFFLRLEDFDVPVGPGYQVGLSSESAPRTAREIRAGNYQLLGPMTTFRGSRNILINPEVLKNNPELRPTRYKSVVIWNADYDVVIATASLN